MPETPRDYKKRIDEKWKRNEKNKEKLIKKIEGYELLDEKFKTKTRQEILANFEKNKKAELEGEQYTTIVLELGKIDKKYEELETLKKELGSKKEEIIHINDEIRECNIDGADETTLKLQMAGVKKLKEKLKTTNDRIQELTEEIKNREKEIKEIEEAYGKKSMIGNFGGNYTANTENETFNQHSQIAGKPESLKEFHKQTIKELWSKDKTRNDIIKLLDAGTGIDDELSEKIRKEIYDKFFEYYDEKQGSLRMKSARFTRNVNRGRRNIDNIKYLCEIGGKPVFQARKNGKYCIIWGDKILGDWFKYISGLEEIGGKPCFIAEMNGKYGMMRGDEQLGNGFDYKYNLKEIGGKPCFEAQIDGKYFVMRGNEQLGEKFDDIYNLQEIGGKPCFKAKKDGKYCIIRGNEFQSEWSDCILDLQEIGGKPCFKSEKDSKRCVIRGNKQQGELFDYVVGDIFEVGGKPYFNVINDWNNFVMRGNEQQRDGLDFKYDLQEIGGKVAFYAKKDGKYFVMRGNEQQGGLFDYVDKLQEVGGKPTFIVKKNGKYCIMRGNEQIGSLFDYLYDIKEIGGKPAFISRNEGKGYCLIRGNKQQGEWFEFVSNLQEIGGKPCFVVRNDSKFGIMWGNELQGEMFDDICDLNYKEVGGKPCFHAGKNGKRCVIRGNKQQCDLLDNVWDLQEIGGKLAFVAYEKGKGYFIMRGDAQYGDYYDSVLCLKEVGGKPYYEVRNKGKWNEVNGDTEYIEETNNNGNENIITETPNENRNLREIRENFILQWYEKKLNRDKLFEILDGITTFDKKEKNNLKSEIISDFYMNYEKSKKNKEFKDADEQYKKLKIAQKLKKKQLKENGEQERKAKNDIKRIENELLEITEKAMKLEDGSFWKKRKLEKTIARRDDLESQRIKLNGDISKLKIGKTLIEGKLKGELKKYGPKIDRIIRKNKNIESTGYQPHEFGSTLKLYKQDYYQTVKEKEKYYEKILDKFKYLDFGISEELKNKTMTQIEEAMENEIKNLKLGDDTVKLADETEKWLEDNRKGVLEKLYNLKWEIEKKENEKSILNAKKDGANPDELKKISEQELELEQVLSKLKSEFQTKKDEIDRKLKEYDGTDIDWGKILYNEGTEEFSEIEKLKTETTLLGYRERYQRIIELKENSLKIQLEGIKTMHIGISHEKGKEVFDLIKSHIDQELNVFKGGDEITKLADETEKWLNDNRKIVIEKILDLTGKIRTKEYNINELKSKEKTANGNDLLQLKDEEFEIQKGLIDLKNECESLKNEIEDKAKRFDGTVIDWTKEVKIESWKEMKEREKREEQIKLAKGKYNNELNDIRSEQQKSWSDEYHKYPHGRCALYESSRAAIEYGDKVCLAMLFDCESDVDSTNGYSDPEQSKIIYVKCGEFEAYKKFVRRHATDSNLDDKSVAYKIITDMKFDGELLQVWLSRGEGWPESRCEFKIK